MNNWISALNVVLWVVNNLEVSENYSKYSLHYILHCSHRMLHWGQICTHNTKIYGHIHTDTQLHRYTDTQLHRHTYPQLHRHSIDTQLHCQTDTQLHRHTDTKLHRQIDTETPSKPIQTHGHNLIAYFHCTKGSAIKKILTLDFCVANFSASVHWIFKIPLSHWLARVSVLSPSRVFSSAMPQCYIHRVPAKTAPGFVYWISQHQNSILDIFQQPISV